MDGCSSVILYWSSDLKGVQRRVSINEEGEIVFERTESIMKERKEISK